MRPDDRGLVTGSSDKHLKFWDFEIKTGAGPSQLTLTHSRALLLTDEVHCVTYSHHTDGSKLLVAAALLDNTIKVCVTVRETVLRSVCVCDFVIVWLCN